MSKRSEQMKITSTALLAAADYHQRKYAEHKDFANKNRKAVERRQSDQSLTRPENREVTAQCAVSADNHAKWAEWHRAVWYACENAVGAVMPNAELSEAVRSAELDSAIRVIDNVAGFDDEKTAVGEAWAVVLRNLHSPNAGAVPRRDVGTSPLMDDLRNAAALEWGCGESEYAAGNIVQAEWHRGHACGMREAIAMMSNAHAQLDLPTDGFEQLPTAHDYERFKEWATNSIPRLDLDLAYCSSNHAEGFYSTSAQQAFGLWWAGLIAEARP